MLPSRRRRKGRYLSGRRRRLSVLSVILLVVFVGLVVFYVCVALSLTADDEKTPQHPYQHPLLRVASAASGAAATANHKPNLDVSYEVQAFYYPWYSNPTWDGRYMHWNHEILPHWNNKITAQFPTVGRHHNPNRDDLGASFYPQLGPYSSADPSIMEKHMKMLVTAGIGVAVVSWLPASRHDDNGKPIAELLGPLLMFAERFGIKIAIHMEPYDGRTPETMRHDIEELLDAHGDSPALYRLARPGFHNKNDPSSREEHAPPLLPLLYIYDQYRVPGHQWNTLLDDPPPPSLLLRGKHTGWRSSNDNGISIRGTKYDAVMLALIVERNHWDEFVVQGGFDGGYTYFASNTFTYGSHPEHWKELQSRAQNFHKLFVPSVGPGYDDTRVRPWNAENTHDRANGVYFDHEWEAAIASGAPFVSVTSFNEWHEGTQIEPAIPKASQDSWTYHDYQVEGGPLAYLERNKQWVQRFVKLRVGS